MTHDYLVLRAIAIVHVMALCSKFLKKKLLPELLQALRLICEETATLFNFELLSCHIRTLKPPSHASKTPVNRKHLPKHCQHHVRYPI